MMTWSAQHLIRDYRPRPGDCSRSEFAQRIEQCRACPLRRVNACQGQILSIKARMKSERCPECKWPGEVKPPAKPVVPEAPRRSIGSLAVVTCYFNPCGYRRIRANYDRFAAGIRAAGVPLYTIELAFDGDPFVIPEAMYVRGTRARHQLWQKERLLNLLIPRVQADAIAWIDADILFLNPGWVQDTCRALERYVVVQPYADAYHLLPEGKLEFLKKSTAWCYHNDRSIFANFAKSHPGFAWAARADSLKRHKLLDSCITGGGDALMVKGMVDTRLYAERFLNPAWERAVHTWTDAAYADVQGALGYAPGSILHLFHGDRKNRQYNTRWRYQTDYGFSPERDLELDEQGLWRWTERAHPEMVARVAHYFAERKEDD